ncbi:MAG TPA: hypothetical protein VMH90_04115, partial [Thermoplasmata archaeon]|nr:hypothetical protein [Thermoplasmata archaeon]
RFLAPVPWDRLTPLLGPGETLTEAEDREVTWVHQGGDERQAAVLAAMHWAQLPLVSARTMDGGLTERYLAAVGREDDG